MSDNARKFCQAVIDGDKETIQKLLTTTNITTWLNDHVSLKDLNNHNYPEDSYFATPLNVALTYSTLDIAKELIEGKCVYFITFLMETL